jgi:hypothetical protein
MPSAIQRFIPQPRLHQVDRVAVATYPAETWTVVRATDLYELRFVRALFTARLLPERVGARLRRRQLEPSPRSARLDEIAGRGPGFRRLAEVPGQEFVAGAIGKFWEPSIPFLEASPETFMAFAEPGFGKVAWSLQVHPRGGGGSWVVVDLRVSATNEEAWRRFGRYWSLVGPFSHVIRKSLLRALVKKLGRPPPEAGRPLAGDELLPSARASNTQAITIESPVNRVWPWLIQMGCRRAGWYSIDRLDNGGVPSADRIIPELQHIAVGDILPATPKGDEGFAVLRVEPERVLVLGSPGLLQKSSPAPKRKRWGLLGADYDATWAFVLEPIGEAATRLTVRVRGNFEPGLRMELARPALLSVHTIMEQAQLRNLKRRAEARH